MLATLFIELENHLNQRHTYWTETYVKACLERSRFIKKSISSNLYKWMI